MSDNADKQTDAATWATTVYEQHNYDQPNKYIAGLLTIAQMICEGSNLIALRLKQIEKELAKQGPDVPKPKEK